MLTEKTEDESVITRNKELVQGLSAQDGVLVSPIDLAITAAKPLQLAPLRWVHFDDPPFRMKLTNSGDTLIMSGKWAKERPFLSGGPLDGNYVFSQAHFHWGSSEHEGSEHTAKGICYPLEMHVVLFKTRYLTQAAALKQDDGIVILAYLFRLQARSGPGLHWLAGQLQSIEQPQTSTHVPPMPLSTVLVPFTADYITYWGALVSQNCRHPVMWLVSRAALAVSAEDLNLFRSLLNTKKEKMTKNFRTPSPAGGRALFHVNPSLDVNNVLLPGAVDPPCLAVIVNYSQMPPVEQTRANTIFEKGDSEELGVKSGQKVTHQKEPVIKSKLFKHEGRPRKNIGDSATNTQQKTNIKNSGSESSSVGHTSTSAKPLTGDKKNKSGTKLQRQCTVSKKPQRKESSKKVQEAKGECVGGTDVTVNIDKITLTKDKPTTAPGNVNTLDKVKENQPNNEKRSQKTKIPVSKVNCRRDRFGLQSYYANYFKRPDSAPIGQSKTDNQQSTKRPSTRTGGIEVKAK